LYTFDLQTRQPKKLTVYVNGERDQAMKRWVNASRQITDFDIAPDGKRAVFAARGEVFTVPAKDGSTRNLTNSPGVREQKVAWSPDGKWIAAVGEEGRAWIWSTRFLESFSGAKGTETDQAVSRPDRPKAAPTHSNHAKPTTPSKGRTHAKISVFHWPHKKIQNP